MTEALIFCGRCSHPMHWKECGYGADLTSGPCHCRNDEGTLDAERARQADPEWETFRDTDGQNSIRRARQADPVGLREAAEALAAAIEGERRDWHTVMVRPDDIATILASLPAQAVEPDLTRLEARSEAWADGFKAGVSAQPVEPGPLDVLRMVGAWLDEYYGPLETYSNDERGMVQLDHGHEEYEARMDVAAAVRAALSADKQPRAGSVLPDDLDPVPGGTTAIRDGQYVRELPEERP